MNARLRLSLILAGVLLTLPACSALGPGAVPKFNYAGGKAGGCANISLYKGSADDREFLRVWTEETKFKVPATGSETYDLTRTPGLHVTVELWEKAPKFLPYCNDISSEEKVRATWNATAGKVTIKNLGPVEKAEGPFPRYKVTVVLEGVVFEDGTGRKVTLEKETMADVVVGWLAG
jgi:hypothetical protein